MNFYQPFNYVELLVNYSSYKSNLAMVYYPLYMLSKHFLIGQLIIDYAMTIGQGHSFLSEEHIANANTYIYIRICILNTYLSKYIHAYAYITHIQIQQSRST